jgi:broad-specificity NMP kinase
MHFLITGSVASGKSEIANEIKKKNPFQRFVIINDKEFSKKENLGTLNKETGEYEVDIGLFSRKISSLFNKKKNIIFEGHLFCEVSKLVLKKMDFVFVLIPKEKILRERMKTRGYNVLKIEENILCFKTNYFEEKLSSKNIDFIKIEVTNDLKLNFKKINKHLKL